MSAKRSVLSWGSCVAISLAATGSAVGNPFSLDSLETGYRVAGADEKKAEGKCGEGKCGATKHMSQADREANAKMVKEGKCGEGKCGVKNLTEGKCGEGKCGARK